MFNDKITSALVSLGGRASIEQVIRHADIKDNIVGFTYRHDWSARNALANLIESGEVEKIKTRWGFSVRLPQKS
jgi:hypothetical protein